MAQSLDVRAEAERARRIASQTLDPEVFRDCVAYYEELQAMIAKPVLAETPGAGEAATLLIPSL